MQDISQSTPRQVRSPQRTHWTTRRQRLTHWLVTASDGTLGNTSTVNQVINVTDVAEATQYTKTMDSGTLAAWGALYNQDMNINNAWADSKIAYTGS